MATGVNDGYYSSTQSVLPSVDHKPAHEGDGGTSGKGQEATMHWVSWLVELQNNITVWWQKRELEERKAFKEQEDAKWAAKKKETHRLTHMHDGIAKAEMERIRKERQQQGNEMKSELKVMEGEIKALKEEWKAHGHELQEKHGYEQTKRIKQSVEECIEEKKEFAAKGKADVRQWNEAIVSERKHTVEQRKQQALEIKKSKLGKAEEGKRYMLDGKTKAVKEVQTMEEKWRQMSKQQMDTFKARAADHRADINATTENMRQARSDLISKHHESVVSERKVKEAHASALFERHKVAERAKRLVRDAVFSARFVSPDKSKMMRDFKARDPSRRSPEQAAMDVGLLDALPARPPSPYRMAGSKNDNHQHLVFKSPLGTEPADNVSINAKTISPERVAQLATPVRPHISAFTKRGAGGPPGSGGPLGHSPSRATSSRLPPKQSMLSPEAEKAPDASSSPAPEA